MEFRRKDLALRKIIQNLELSFSSQASFACHAAQPLMHLMNSDASCIILQFNSDTAHFCYRTAPGLDDREKYYSRHLDEILIGDLPDLLSAINHGHAKTFRGQKAFDICDHLFPEMGEGHILILPMRYEPFNVGSIILFRSKSKPTFKLTETTRSDPLCKRLARIGIQSFFEANAKKGSKSVNKPNLLNYPIDEGLLSIMNNVRDSVVLVNQDLCILACNQSASDLFDIPPSELIYNSIIKYLPDYHLIQLQQMMNLSEQDIHDSFKSFKHTLLKLDGAINYLEIELRNVFGKPDIWWVNIRDVTELQELRTQKNAELGRFKAITDVSPMGLMQTDHDWQCVYANEKWLELIEYDETLLRETNWLNIIPPERINEFVQDLHSAVEHNVKFEIEFPMFSYQLSQDQQTWLRLIAEPANFTDGLVLLMEDVTDKHFQRQRLELLANTDSLTKLANRTIAYETLKQYLINLAPNDAITVLSIDLDGFKLINDTKGHDAGDKVLITIGKRLHSCIRQKDMVARVGGDEFIVILTECGAKTAVSKICDEILTSVSKPIELDNKTIYLSASIGVCIVDQPEADIAKVLKSTDVALYDAKNSGRNRYCFYSSSLSLELEEKIELRNNTRDAFKNDEFELFFQLQFRADEGKFIGMEALLRWPNNDGFKSAPEKFIPVIEELGLIGELTNKVINESLRSLKSLLDQKLLDEDASVSVNFSPRLFKDTQIVEQIKCALDAHGMHPKNLTIEITETTLFENEQQALEVMKALQDMGVKLSLDDFGTGFSPLAYLTQFNVDQIKLDKTFIMNLDNLNTHALCTSLIILAKSLNMELVAEGVENKHIFEELSEIGSPVIQGFYFHEPSPFIDVQQYLATKH